MLVHFHLKEQNVAAQNVMGGPENYMWVVWFCANKRK